MKKVNIFTFYHIEMSSRTFYKDNYTFILTKVEPDKIRLEIYGEMHDEYGFSKGDLTTCDTVFDELEKVTTITYAWIYFPTHCNTLIEVFNSPNPFSDKQ